MHLFLLIYSFNVVHVNEYEIVNLTHRCEFSVCLSSCSVTHIHKLLFKPILVSVISMLVMLASGIYFLFRHMQVFCQTPYYMYVAVLINPVADSCAHLIHMRT